MVFPVHIDADESVDDAGSHQPRAGRGGSISPCGNLTRGQWTVGEVIDDPQVGQLGLPASRGLAISSWSTLRCSHLSDSPAQPEGRLRPVEP